MTNLKKIYISIEWLSKKDKDQISKLNYLNNEKDQFVVWSKFEKVDTIWDWRSNNISALELYVFNSYLLANWYKLENIEIISNKPMFIMNDDLYEIKDWKCEIMETNKVWFFSIWWDDWKNPFYFLLKSIIENKKWKLKKTNYLNDFPVWKWKFYALNSLYKERKDLIWWLVYPYNITPDLYEIFFSFLKDNFSKNIILKRDFSCWWHWVVLIDLEKNYYSKKEIINDMFDTHKETYKHIYIVPYENIRDEFRIYFTKINWKIKLYSFKKKSIISTYTELLDLNNFWNIQFNWDYVENNKWEKYRGILKIAKKYIKILWYTTWILEFWKTYDDKNIFFEVNPMWSPLCFEWFWWEDVKNIVNYYNSIFDDFLDNK
jgi:hypothetical protein